MYVYNLKYYHYISFYLAFVWVTQIWTSCDKGIPLIRLAFTVIYKDNLNLSIIMFIVRFIHMLKHYTCVNFFVKS